MERIIDKRKARDKETDDESMDTSMTKNPTKRPRVDYSSSPKEKSPSPASAQKSPMGRTTVGDSFNAATPAPVMDMGGKSGNNNNGDVADKVQQGSAASSNNVTTAPVISKFDLPSPFTTQELEQMGKSSDGAEDNDSDNDSTKFYTEILQSEENKRKRQGKGKGGGNSNGNGTPVNNNAKRVDKGTSATSNMKSGNKFVHHPIMSSSPNSDSASLNSYSGEVEVTLKICDPNNRQNLEEIVFRSDIQRVDLFLKEHNMKLSISSHSSGYLGDVSSSIENSAGAVQTSSNNRSNSRWTISSLGSTIPRQSIVSIATETSESPEELMKRPGKPAPVSKARKRSDGPIATSTKIDDSGHSSLDRMNVSPNVLSNGEDHLSTTVSSNQHTPKSQSSAKMFKNSSSLSKDEGIGTTPASSTPGSSRRSKAVLNKDSPKQATTPSTANTSINSNSERSGKKPGARRRVGSANNFPITRPQVTPGSPAPARSVAKIEGTSAKPLSRFEEEMNNEPVVESDLQMGATLWSTILPGELVFARWRDKNYYSGMVKTKGLNDTWIIDYDDGMEDVASETHIVPIKILGVGVKGIYTPDGKYDPHTAEVIGQKFGKDPESGSTVVKYAIKCQGDTKPIWCSRRQLSIKEVDAKKLRTEYQPPVVIKAGDVSLDNIVAGPRRRTRGGAESASQDSKLIAGAFDASIAEENSGLSTSTPKGRGGAKGGKKTPASEAKKKRGQGTTNTPQTKDASTSSPGKDSSSRESPSKSSIKFTVELGRKKSKKTLFHGMQFFLTASGGGDPGINGNPVVPVTPYDKDEYRELIESCGGEVLDNVGSQGTENVFLISDSYARTVKYIYCLAAGVPCVSHTWIKNCIDQHEILDWNIFHLPAGWSIEHQDLIRHHKEKPLKGCKIFVTSESDQLYNYWKPVLTAAEAILLKPPKKKGATAIPAGTEVVVSDNHCESTKEVLDEAAALSIPVVKPEWLVQTIICGEKAHMYGHDKYKVLLNDTESEEVDGAETTVDGESGHFSEVLANMETPD